MSNFPDSFDEQTRLITEEVAGEKGGEALAKLDSLGYEVRAGLTAEYAEEISNMALEPLIQKYCPKDCSERFKDEASTRQWLSKQRAAFLLIKKSADGPPQLAGYAWVGASRSEHVPNGETTFALRVGQDHQGHGLAAPFSQLVLLAAARLNGAKNIWLETWNSNQGAVHIYHKLGFIDTDRQAGELAGQPDTRLYMALPDELLA
jgi:ribosomal protein S18 acetylase RimI-like enzyme